MQCDNLEKETKQVMAPTDKQRIFHRLLRLSHDCDLLKANIGSVLIAFFGHPFASSRPGADDDT